MWRSDDGGQNWYHLEYPQPDQLTIPTDSLCQPGTAGALCVPNVYNVVVSPADKDIVLATTFDDARVQAEAKNGIYRSADGGLTWTLVHQFQCSQNEPAGMKGAVSQIVFAPDNSNLVYAAGGCAIAISQDAGAHWSEAPMAGKAWRIAVAPQEGLLRRAYASGEWDMWYSEDGGQTWFKDKGSHPYTGGYPDKNPGSSAVTLALEPGHSDHLYLAAVGGGTGRLYFYPNNNPADGTLCSGDCNNYDGSLWFGDYSSFDVNDITKQSASWAHLTDPPVYGGDGMYVGESSGSGNVFVVAKAAPITNDPNRYLLFFSDRNGVHVSAGKPTDTSWHRLTGRDVSMSIKAGGKDLYYVHADPHAFVFTPDFNITLKAATGVAFPYDRNSEFDQLLGGKAWMANDGGVYYSTDGGESWTLASGLSTLQVQARFAGLIKANQAPALYMGVPDDDNFFSLDGGSTWGDPWSQCGDCGPWFSDNAQNDIVLERDRGASLSLWRNPTPGTYPDPADGTQRIGVPISTHKDANNNDVVEALSSNEPHLGSRPIIQTLQGESPPNDGGNPPKSDIDFVTIRYKSGSRSVVRTASLSTIANAGDWDTKFSQKGPVFPADMNHVNVVQASGGHTNTVFYVGDPSSSNDPGATMGLWKWQNGMASWQKIVPGTGATHARRFFASPYDPDLIYIIDDDAVKRSVDGGATWQVDLSLDAAATESGNFSYVGNDYGPGAIWRTRQVITDMIFVRDEPNTRFAMGNAGVFATADGDNWIRLLSSTAMPMYPITGFFDNISNPNDRALYVATDGRGILKLHPLSNADITITKAGAPNPVLAGKNLTYTITVTNNGPSQATKVMLQDDLPAGVTFVSATPGAGTCGQAVGVVVCDIGDMAVGANVTVTIVVTSPALGNITNSARVVADTMDPDFSNNEATVVTVVQSLLTVNLNPAAGGTVTGIGISCPGECSEIFTNLTNEVLTATPNAGYSFEGWTGCTIVANNQCTVLTDVNKTVTATFAPRADLIISSLTTDYVTHANLGSVTLKFRVKNIGLVDAGATVTTFYLSRDTAYGAGDITIDSVATPPLAVGAETPETIVHLKFNSPWRSGDVYAIAVADAGKSVTESNEANNTKAILVQH